MLKEHYKYSLYVHDDSGKHENDQETANVKKHIKDTSRGEKYNI